MNSASEPASIVRRLHLVARAGKVDSIKQALAMGADVNALCENDNSALTMAISGGHLLACKYLIEQKADVNHPDVFGHGPLQHACNDADSSGEIVKLLLDSKANIDACSKNGLTPMLSAVTSQSAKLVKLLLEHKADARKTTSYADGTLRLSALEIAVATQSHEIVALLGGKRCTTSDLRDGGAHPLDAEVAK